MLWGTLLIPMSGETCSGWVNMNKYFFADTHLNQPFNRENTPFSSLTIQDWDDMIIENINSTVDRKNYLYILGDFCDPKKLNYFRHKIYCRHIKFIRGNHDAKIGRLKQVFGENNVFDQTTTKVNGRFTVLNHYPMAYWEQSHRGSWHLHGHTHGNRELTMLNAFPGYQGLDVGPESAWQKLGVCRPFSEQEISDILSDVDGHDHVEWYDENRYRNNRYLFGGTSL